MNILQSIVEKIIIVITGVVITTTGLFSGTTALPGQGLPSYTAPVTQESTASATPTTKPITKELKTEKKTISVTTTFQPKPQKVAVFLAHNGTTKDCDTTSETSISSASNTILQKENEKKECENKMISDAQQCADNCKAISDAGTAKCFQTVTNNSLNPSSLVACKESVSNQAYYCLDQCRARVISCPLVSQTYYDSLNTLLSKYCN